MSKSTFRFTPLSGELNRKPISATHWERQASISVRLANVVNTLHVDASTLTPWREGAAVLGVTLSEYVERILREGGQPWDAADYLEGQITDRLYLSQAEAQAASERWELWSVTMRLRGHDLPVLAATPVPREHGRWGIAVDLLAPDGWMSQRTGEPRWWGDDENDEEQWKEARR
jgi:hypothetical protein